MKTLLMLLFIISISYSNTTTYTNNKDGTIWFNINDDNTITLVCLDLNKYKRDIVITYDNDIYPIDTRNKNSKGYAPRFIIKDVDQVAFIKSILDRNFTVAIRSRDNVVSQFDVSLVKSDIDTDVAVK